MCLRANNLPNLCGTPNTISTVYRFVANGLHLTFCLVYWLDFYNQGGLAIGGCEGQIPGSFDHALRAGKGGR